MLFYLISLLYASNALPVESINKVLGNIMLDTRNLDTNDDIPFAQNCNCGTRIQEWGSGKETVALCGKACYENNNCKSFGSWTEESLASGYCALFDKVCTNSCPQPTNTAAGYFNDVYNREYVLAEQGANTCPVGTVNVGQGECLHAVEYLVPKYSALSGVRAGLIGVVDGWNRPNGWSVLPGGCSSQTAGDGAAHWNNNANGNNGGSYSLLCKKKYVLAQQGANTCPVGTMEVDQGECLHAVEYLVPKYSALSGVRAGLIGVVDGWNRPNGWSVLPGGCSSQTGGDGAAHWNNNANGNNDGGYSLLCKKAFAHNCNCGTRIQQWGSGKESVTLCRQACYENDDCKSFGSWTEESVASGYCALFDKVCTNSCPEPTNTAGGYFNDVYNRDDIPFAHNCNCGTRIQEWGSGKETVALCRDACYENNNCKSFGSWKWSGYCALFDKVCTNSCPQPTNTGDGYYNDVYNRG